MRLPRPFSSLLVATLAATTLTTSIAAACGGYVRVDPAPHVLAVSTHGLMSKDGWTSRSFVVVEESVKIDDPKQWRALAPGTYDGTLIANAPSLYGRSRPQIEVTLVGPSGTRVVKSDKRVALSRSWQIGFDQSRIAFEVPFEKDDQFAIALAGRVTDAKWRELDYQQAPASTLWWLARQGIKDPQYVAIRAIAGSDLEVVQFSDANDKSQLYVRRGDDVVGTGMGSSVGVVTTNGRSFLVVNVDSQMSTLELPALITATARS